MRMIAFVIAAILFSSCTGYVFEDPQPKGKKDLTSFPEELQGFYAESDDDKLEPAFTVEEKKVIFEDDDEATYTLGKNAYLRFYKDLYWFSTPYEKDERFWEVTVVQIHENGDLTLSLFDSENDDLPNQLRAITRVQVRDLEPDNGKEDKTYIMNPRRKELLNMWRQGLFGSSERYTRIPLDGAL